jgi:hypothetical protein
MVNPLINSRWAFLPIQVHGLTCHCTADLKELIESHGGTFSSTVKANCTHLITSEKIPNKLATKGDMPCNVLLFGTLCLSEDDASPKSPCARM